MSDYKNLKDLDAKDWIILRLLYYILATDGSAVHFRDVTKTRRFIQANIHDKAVCDAYEMIRKEHIALGQYDNPECASVRELKKMAEEAAKNAGPVQDPPDIIEYEPLYAMNEYGNWERVKPK
jgi:hypothetical protein